MNNNQIAAEAAKRLWNLGAHGAAGHNEKIIQAAIEKVERIAYRNGYADGANTERAVQASKPAHASEQAECAVCGEQLQAVRPGKFQHVGECKPRETLRQMPEATGT